VEMKKEREKFRFPVVLISEFWDSILSALIWRVYFYGGPIIDFCHTCVQKISGKPI